MKNYTSFLITIFCFVLLGCQAPTEQPTPLSPTLEPTLEPTTSPITPTLPIELPTTTPTEFPTVNPTEPPTAIPTTPPLPPAVSKIPLELNENGSFGNLAVINSDGSGYEQLTTYGYNADPQLSPNQQVIAYRSIPSTIINGPNKDSLLHEGYYNIWVIAADGSEAWKLTDSQEKRSIPSWHSDSERVIFSEGEHGRLLEVNFKTQTTQELAPAGVLNPVYRPDGRAIVYHTPQKDIAWRDETGQVTILFNHLDWLTYETEPSLGLDATSFASQLQVLSLAWHPQQPQIFVSTEVSSPDGNPFVTRKITLKLFLDGTPPEQTPQEFNAGQLRFSPSGQYLAIHSISYGDACFPGLGLNLIKLPTNELIRLSDFTHAELLTMPDEAFVYPTSLTHWLTDDLAIVQINYTCIENHTFAGPYLLNLATQEMTQLAHLP